MIGGRMIELAFAVLVLGAGVYFYRRRPAGNVQGAARYGNQGAVILLVVGVIVAIHALGGLDYHPSASEIERMQEGQR